MVRVISIHNFQRQLITPIDEVIDVETVPPDLLLLVQSNHTILVKNLLAIGVDDYTIPTVDEVKRIIYSLQGNYIGTLESKVSRSGELICFVRIYLNWDTLKKNGFQDNNAPMRARIAGRVTPSGQNQHDLEMIEIPTQLQPENISCCKISGNLIIAAKNILSVYKFVTQTHDISKLYFVDFELLPIDFQISFVPKIICIAENIIAVQSDDYLHVFEIRNPSNQFSEHRSDISVDDFEKLQKSRRKYKNIGLRSINYEKLIKENKEYQAVETLSKKNVDDETSETSYETDFNNENELTKLDFQSFPIIHEFPTVAIERSLVEPKCSDAHRQNPFIINKDLTVNVVHHSPLDNTDIVYDIKNILQYQLTALLIGSSTNKELQEKYTCIKLKPYYSNNKGKKNISEKRFLESEHFRYLRSIACFFATQQEGYLFCFDFGSRHNKKRFLEKATCCAVYPFTAPVIDVALEESLLHALTDTGLETYSVRAAQYILKNNKTEACPNQDDPICLLGLRPFLNVQKLVLTNNYLSLFANTDETATGMWTLYSLEIPDPALIWNDFLNLAEENRYEAPTTFCQLIGEGHLILKTYLNNIHWNTSIDMTRSQISVASPVTYEAYYNSILKLYLQSCALLADCHILSNNYDLATKYYKMTKYKIVDIIKNIQRLYSEVPSTYADKYIESEINKGLIYVLTNFLNDYNLKYINCGENTEEFFTPEIGYFVNVLMDLLEKEAPDSVSGLVLESPILRDYGTDRVLKIMKTLLSKRGIPQDKDAVSLALMCIQKGQTDQAKTVLQSMKKSSLHQLLLEHCNLLLDRSSTNNRINLSELTIVIIDIYPETLASILITVVLEKKLFTLADVLETFLDFMPSSCNNSKSSTLVLQLFLEDYILFYFKNVHNPFESHEEVIARSLKILVRIYLSGLQTKNKVITTRENMLGFLKTKNILFFDKRYKYLDEMPPFTSEIFSPLCSDVTSLDEEQTENLIKLQSLLSSKFLPDQCVQEIKNFLSSQPKTYGYISLQAACGSSVQEIVQLLINSCPQALFKYCIECVTEVLDWKFIVAQLQKKMNSASEDSRKKFYYEKTLSDVLQHLAESVQIDKLIEIFPNDFENSEKFLIVAQNTAQANHIQTLIMVTGQQLLATL